MPFDVYMRGASIVAMSFAAVGYLMLIDAGPCASAMLVLFFMFVQGPAVVCALVAPFVWRVAQARPIERKTKILFTWALIVTAFQVTLAAMANAHGCFR